MIKCNLFLASSKDWMGFQESCQCVNDKAGVYQMVKTAIYTYMDQESFFLNEEEDDVTVRIIENCPENIKKAFESYPKPVLTFTNDKNETLVIPEDRKKDPKEIAGILTAWMQGKTGNGGAFGENEVPKGASTHENKLPWEVRTFRVPILDDVADAIMAALGALGKPFFYVAAALSAKEALDAKNQTAKVTYGALSAYLVFRATQSDEKKK